MHRLPFLCLAASLLGLSPLQNALVAQRGAPQGGSAAGLHIVVIEGEDAVNVVRQKTAVAPVVEVRDRNDQPVAGAIVQFAIRRGSATFAHGRTLAVTTNAAGRAVAAGLTPTGTGTLQIAASASFQGQTAAITIAQTNVLTAAAGAGASGAGASGGAGTTGAAAGGGASGGLSGTAIGAIFGGAAVGSAVAIKAAGGGHSGGSPPPSLSFVLASPNGGVLSATVIAFSTQSSGTNLTFAWDFGDGATAASATPMHQYTSAGSFTVRVTVTDQDHRSDSNQATVTIKSITGRWLVNGGPNFFDFVQSGTSVTGTFTTTSGADAGFPNPVTGSVQNGSPAFTMVISRPLLGPIAQGATFTGNPTPDVNGFIGFTNGGGFPNNTATNLLRQ